MRQTMETPTHRVLEHLEQVWPYLTGMVVVTVATVKLWLYERRRISKIEDTYVTKDELAACRNDVRSTDDKNLSDLTTQINKLSSENAQQHQDILTELINIKK